MENLINGNSLLLSVFLPAGIAFCIVILASPILIPFLQKLKFGQTIRDEGPESHLKKNGTPTMGGIAILLAILFTSLIFLWQFPDIIPVLIMTIGFGIIGFVDDFIKVVKKQSEGLTVIQKLIFQFVVTAVFVLYYFYIAKMDTYIKIPFIAGPGFYMPEWLFAIFVFIVVLGTVNGTNFTDGLDGLASSVTSIVAVFFVIASLMINTCIAPFPSMVVGALLGFLIFNTYPARVFMGDTGSLAIGGFVSSIALMLHLPLFIVIVGLIYLVEVLSVMIQVAYFKISHGKRIFKMAPIHHHFELSGFFETQVVTGFTITTIILCIVGLLALCV